MHLPDPRDLDLHAVISGVCDVGDPGQRSSIIEAAAANDGEVHVVPTGQSLERGPTRREHRCRNRAIHDRRQRTVEVEQQHQATGVRPRSCPRWKARRGVRKFRHWNLFCHWDHYYSGARRNPIADGRCRLREVSHRRGPPQGPRRPIRSRAALRVPAIRIAKLRHQEFRRFDERAADAPLSGPDQRRAGPSNRSQHVSRLIDRALSLGYIRRATSMHPLNRHGYRVA
jgi:hypothetical protein